MDNNLDEQMMEFFIGEKTFGDYIIKKQMIYDDDNGSNLYHSFIRTGKSNKLASVLFVHGLGEHSSRYIDLAKFLADENFFVHLFDFRGYGYSSGNRNSASLKNLNEDLISIFTQIRKDLPFFVVCHSMGAGVILSLLRKNNDLKISGVIFSNPFIDFPPQLNIGLKQQILIKMLPEDFNLFLINSQICPYNLTKSPKYLKRIFKDRFLQPVTSFKMIQTLMDIKKNLKTTFNNNKFDYPSLFIIGKQDKICKNVFLHRFLKTMTFEDLEIHEFNEGFHELLLDDENERAFKLIVDWIKPRLTLAKNFEFPSKIDLEIPKSKTIIFLRILFVLIILYIIKRKRPKFFNGIFWVFGLKKKIE